MEPQPAFTRVQLAALWCCAFTALCLTVALVAGLLGG